MYYTPVLVTYESALTFFTITLYFFASKVRSNDDATINSPITVLVFRENPFTVDKLVLRKKEVVGENSRHLKPLTIH